MKFGELDVAKLVLNPGDRLIFRSSNQIKAEQRRLLCETIREAYPGVDFAIVTPGLEVEVQRAPMVCEAPEA